METVMGKHPKGYNTWMTSDDPRITNADSRKDNIHP